MCLTDQSSVEVEGVDATVGRGDEHLALHALLAAEHHAVDAANADRSAEMSVAMQMRCKDRGGNEQTIQ